MEIGKERLEREKLKGEDKYSILTEYGAGFKVKVVK